MAMDSRQTISDVIGVIYDCVLEPRLWTTAVTQVCTRTNFATGALAVNALPSGEAVVSTAVGISASDVGRLAGYGGEVMQIWGGVARVMQYPLDEPVLCSRASDRRTWQFNAFYTEWGVPQGLIDAVSIPIAREPNLLGNITFGRHARDGDVTDEELDVLRLFAPHIRRAATISRLFDREARAAATLAAAFDALTVAVGLVDGDLTVVHANTRMDALLKAGTVVRIETGRLQVCSAMETDALRKAVAAAARDEASLGTRGISLPVGGDLPLVVHVLPLGRRPRRGGLPVNALAAVFVAPASSVPRLPTDALAVIYDLTPAESRVCEMVIEGRTQAEIAVSLGIAPSTVKTHLLRVFSKTGRHRQAELVQLAASLSMGL